MLDQTLLKLVKHDLMHIAEFVTYMNRVFFTVESTAQTDWYWRIDGDPIKFPVCTIIMKTR